MKPWIFCNRCRGLEVGWNRNYVRHSLTCGGGVSRSLKLLVLALATLLVVFLFPTYTMSPSASNASVPEAPPPREAPPGEVSAVSPDATVLAVDDLLGRHARVNPEQRLRIARAVVGSSRRHDVDPFLVTGILIAESSGNPVAISHRQAVGIMQIHVPTWGPTAEEEGLNLFLLEDNIDLGTRILRDYTRRYGLWEGVMRYLGTSEPTSEALAYVQRVQGVFTDRQAD
jgi:hypothetical protein